MTCKCCKDALEWPGTVAARTYTPACLWCGARYIKRTPVHGRTREGRPFTKDEAREEMRRILAIWTGKPWYHSEAEIRRLVKLPDPPLAPELSEQPRKRGG